MSTQTNSVPNTAIAPLFSYRERLRGKRLIVIGGTGFLGKVWWSFLLSHCPDLGQIYLVVRSKPGLSSEARFWRDVAASESMSGLKQQHGEGLYEFFRQKISVIDGDITQPFCGLTDVVRDQLRGNVDAVVNASGIVDFQPPLDVALDVNAFGAQSLVALAKDLGNVPVMHTSTCYVSGYKTGIIEEEDPLKHPFPYAGKLELAHWDPDREINECLDIIEQAKHRAGDAFRQSDFLAQAIVNLEGRAEPASGLILDQEIERVRRKFIEAQLSNLGLVRAQFWGWPNTYTYTKSIGEQIVARSGLGYCIVRPAIIESCVSFPQRGWNEGINTSAPLIYAIREGLAQLPGGPICLDVIPCDMVSAGMTLALAELVAGEAKPVYQFGTGDSNPITMSRIYELSGLYKRKYYQRSRKGSALVRRVQSHVEGALLSPDAFARFGPKAIAREATRVADLFDKAPDGALNTLLNPVTKNLRAFAKTQNKIAEVVLQFQPFTAELDYEFRCDNTRNARARLIPEEREDMCFTPDTIDWRDWFLNTHCAGLERWVFPELEQKLKKHVKALRRHESLGRMLREMAQRFGLGVALQEVGPEGLTRTSYTELYERAELCARGLLQRGDVAGERVGLWGPISGDWVVALFGIWLAGAVAVPIDGESDARRLTWVGQLGVRQIVCSNEQMPDCGLPCVSLSQVQQAAVSNVVLPEVNAEQVALILRRDLREGAVAEELTVLHRELTAAVAALGPLFPFDRADRVLPIGRLSSAAQISTALLLPLSRGAQVVIPTAENVESALAATATARATALIGSSSDVERWARLLKAELGSRGKLGMLAQRRLAVNHSFGRSTGLDIGRFLFGKLHHLLGRELRQVIALGAGTDAETRRFLAGVGLPVSDCFAIAEAAGPISASLGRFGGTGKTLGRATPDVEVKVVHPDPRGVGEVWVKGPAVSAKASDASGWLRTTHLGSLDTEQRLQVNHA